MTKLSKFKEDLSNSIYITPDNRPLFDQIPESFYANIFRDNFNSDNDLAKKILFKEYKDIDLTELEKQTKRIFNFSRAMKTIQKYIDEGKKLVFVTDVDNDGSLSQAIIYEFKRLFPEESQNIHILFSQNFNGNTTRGFTCDLLEKWAEVNGVPKDEDFLMLTADNGVNNREEQLKIEKSFSSCQLIITDHHLPDPKTFILDNDRTCLFNPKNKPINAFKGSRNISGAHTLGVLLKNTAIHYKPDVYTRNFQNLCFIANFLDYVNTDIRFKPFEEYLVDKFGSLGALLNVNNSMTKIITGDTSIEYVDSVIKNIPQINKDEFMDALSVVSEQNLVASKLLFIQKEFDEMTEQEEIDELDLNSFLSRYIEILVDDDKFTHFNTNYIEQLRGRIYHHAANGYKSEYEAGIENAMVSVFSRLRVAEKRLVAEMRKGDIMNIIKLDNATIMYPKYPEINLLFGRKFLGKVFNEEINGFLSMFDGSEHSKRTGSCRTLFNLSELLADRSSLPDYIDLSSQGHEKAAGFFVERNDGKKLTDNDMNIVTDFMQERIDTLKDDLSYNQKYVHVDFQNIGLIQDINRQVKANINNVSGINPVIKLNRSMHFTDKETLKTISVGELLKKEKYGYTLLNLNFHGDTIIMPTEIVRQLSKNNYKDYLQVNYMSEGAFIGYKVIQADKLKAQDIIRLDSPKKAEQDNIAKYYEENFYNKKTFVQEVTRKDMLEADFFKNNGLYGEKEFEAVESLFISIIDKYSANLDDKNKNIIISVIDTEANGLGKAPKLFNFGAFDISIDPNSGTTISLKDFLSEYNTTKTIGGQIPKNFKINFEDNTVTYDRKIQGELVSMLIRDKDFKLTQEISTLTGVSQAMLNKYGVTTGEADVFLAERYSKGNYIMQAHNSNYDVGVLASNTPQYKAILDKNMVCDSARFAKEERLAYPDTYVATLCPEASSAFFFNDPLADYSISKLLKKEGDMHFPDLRGDYLVKTKGEDVFLINLKTDVEVQLPYTKTELAENIDKRNTDLHLNMLKYSVVVLAKFENIRAVVLHDLEEKIKFIPTPKDILDPNLAHEPFDEKIADKLFKEFCKDYHFDCNIRTNLDHFRDAILLEVNEGLRDEKELFLFCPDLALTEEEKIQAAKVSKLKAKNGEVDETESFYDLFSRAGMEFLKANKELHLSFTTIWEYQKVLDVYDPHQSVKDTDPSVLKGVSYITGLPIDRIEVIADKVFAYKQAYNLKDIYTKELHNNVNKKGDCMIEGLLIGQRLMRKHYNSYAKQKHFTSALNIYANTLETTSYRNINRQHMEVEIGEAKINSYSQKQMESYSSRRVDAEGNINLSPIILNACDPKYTKWQLRSLPPGSFIEARPDEEFILNTLFGKDNVKKYLSKVKSLNDFDAIDCMAVFEVDIQGKAKKLSPAMKEVLNSIDDEMLERKRDEIIGKFVTISKRMAIVDFLTTPYMHKNLKDNLQEVLEDEKSKYNTMVNQLSAAIPNFESLQEKVLEITKNSFTTEQYNAAKTNNAQFLNTKKMTLEEKSSIETKMEFIAKAYKIQNSIDKQKNMNPDTLRAIDTILSTVKGTVNTYLSDIEERIGALQFTRSENDIKDTVGKMWEAIQGKSEFSSKTTYHKDYYIPFYEKVLVEFKELNKKLGLPFIQKNYDAILTSIRTMEEPEYKTLEDSLNAFSRNPSKFILEDAQELLRQVLSEKVEKQLATLSNKSDVMSILMKKQSDIEIPSTDCSLKNN